MAKANKDQRKPETGHTVGTWQFEGNCITTRSAFPSVGIAILEPMEKFWCDEVDRLPEGREMEANGHLLAAAPGLLAALEKIVGAMNANPEPIHYAVRQAINDARAAMDEAKGNI
jgi:hypothetical protein